MTGNPLDGYAACAVSVTFFGSMFVPIKHQDCGDGLFVQWVMGAAIFMVGMIVNAVEGFPTFHPFAMLGGVFWAVGNVTAVPILSMIGMGMGILIWGTTNCLTGWATDRFGLFGLKQNIPSSVFLNYFGLFLVIFGGMLFSQLRPTPRRPTLADRGLESNVVRVSENVDHAVEEHTSLLETLREIPTASKTILGASLSLIAGVFYGLTFVPVIYIQEHPEKFKDASPYGLPYVFAHFSGIFVTTTTFFLLYAIFKRNRPFVNHRVVLPAYMTGTMWAIAQSAWFVANDRLSQSVSFPINSMVPGVCASLWSVFYFREIEGKRNLRLLVTAIIITLFGAVLVGLSKDA